MWQSPSEGLSCAWGEEDSGSVLRAGITGWKEAEHLTCHPSKVSACTGIQICKNYTSPLSLLLPPMCQPCHHPAKTQQHRAPLNSLPQCCFLTALVLTVHTENKQHLMVNLGSTWQRGTTAASRYNPSCWDHLAFNGCQGPVCLWLPGPGRSQSSTPLPHSRVFWGAGSLQPCLQCWAHLAWAQIWGRKLFQADNPLRFKSLCACLH